MRDPAPAPAEQRRAGIAWYRRNDYKRVRAAMADADRLPSGYDEWLFSAEQVERTVREAGVHVIRVQIDADSFIAWCRERDLRPDGAARSQYATDAAKASADP